jgi:large exoprotein involved in heme utilization and adhesion
LQFGENPGKIINRSNASNSNVFGLEIKPEQTLALIGGDVLFEGGSVTTDGGKIEIGSVGKNSLVNLDGGKQTWNFNYENVQNFQDIQLTKRFDELFFAQFGFLVPSFINVNSSNGNSGEINIQGRSLLVDGSQISLLTQDSTSSGNLTINAAETVNIINNSSTNGGVKSTLASGTIAEGNAGNIEINTKKLSIDNGAFILTESSAILDPRTKNIVTVATGKSGNININASKSVNIQGAISSQTEGLGEAGNIKLETGKLNLNDTGTITAGSNGNSNAGNIEISADTIKLDRQGQIVGEALSGDGGNIFLQAQNLLILRHQSQISTTAGIQEQGGSGGNIKISSPLVVAFPKENSDISANAFTGKGGNIEIRARSVLGFQSDNRVTSFSDITASSELGENGTVRIFLPEVHPEQRIAVLTEKVVDLTDFERYDLCRLRRDTTFTASGRGGIAYDITKDLRSANLWEDWRVNDQVKTQRRTETIRPNNKREIVNIQGWYINDRGRVVLTDRPMDSFFPHLQASGLECR